MSSFLRCQAGSGKGDLKEPVIVLEGMASVEVERIGRQEDHEQAQESKMKMVGSWEYC